MKRFHETIEWLCYSLGLAILSISVVLVPQNRLLGRQPIPVYGTGCPSLSACNNGCYSDNCLENGDIDPVLDFCTSPLNTTICSCLLDPDNCGSCYCRLYHQGVNYVCICSQ